ncbi:MAG: adenosylcobinamide-phosphate synthase [Alphaproteobacteria bacterium]|jgi:adenosylcobinamide-phosphate synthase|nr:adenosylcobinamide-phosphate synthase [Alphaproteobacteria bacterium]
MAADLIHVLAPHPVALAIAVLADLALGDPVYRWHPVRLVGDALNLCENGLRAIGADGYGGGIALFAILAAGSVAVVTAILFAALSFTPPLAWLLHVLLLYALLALGALLRHVWRVERAVARGDLAAARAAVGELVGRDTDRMDGAACRRAAIESLSENLTDGFTSALFWYALAGLPGLVVFKVVSTMDSMVGYKTPRYRRFGWCGARLDDAMNYLPARLTWLLIAAVAAALPGCSPRKAFVFGLRHHALLPSPNSGWSEAATAGAIRRRLVGPIWKQGALVTDIWLGDPGDPPAGTRDDMLRAMILTTAAGLVAATGAAGALLLLQHHAGP